MLIEHELRRRKLREATQIDLYTAEPGPMGVAGPKLSKAVRELVEARGIGYHPGLVVTEVDAKARVVKFTSGAEAGFDLLAYVPPHRAPRILGEAGLLAPGGWVAVDRHTLATSFERVYALGDMVSIPLALGQALPKAGVFAHGEAEVVAKNIARAVTGKGAPASYGGEAGCFIETGGGKAGLGKGNFYAEPLPQISMYAPGRHWHAAKILFEKNWLRRWF